MIMQDLQKGSWPISSRIWTGAAVMPVAVIVLIFLFDWRLGICCLIPMGISVIFLKQMMGGDNAQFMGKYMTALETMNKEAVEYIRGIPVVKVFQQTIYSFKNFHAAIEEYEKFASGYALKMSYSSYRIYSNAERHICFAHSGGYVYSIWDQRTGGL